MALVTLYLAFFISKINAHSWTRCTDYKGTITGRDYNEADCEGWIRGWQFNSVLFGQDRGINYQVGVGGGQDLCQNTLSGSAGDDYSGSYGGKMATYAPGSRVRVVWPAKNHANYECFGNIPDTSMKLFMNPTPNPTGDIANTQSTMGAQGYQLVKDWQDGCTPGTDGCGFQNCPKFCEDTDKATCWGDFIVPDVDTSGYYTFVWYWIFNPGSPYISCWEAYIDINGVVKTPDDAVVVPPTPAPVSGGTPVTAPTPPPVSADGITITNKDITQDYYLTFILSNIVSTGCSDTISSVSILENGVWREQDNQYEQNGYVVAWDYQDTTFGSLLPISVRISTTGGKNIDLTDIITTITDKTASFGSDQTICGGTVAPPTPAPVSPPTTKPPTDANTPVSPPTPAPVTPAPVTPAPVDVIITEYITQIPLCITGQQYVRSAMETFIYNQFDTLVTQDDVNVIAVSPGTDSFDFTAQISHQNPGLDIYETAANDLCNTFELLFAGTTCTNCDEIKTFALYGTAPTPTSSPTTASPAASPTDPPSDASTTGNVNNPNAASPTIKYVSCLISLFLAMFFV